jgi:benzodiazapine receptor
MAQRTALLGVRMGPPRLENWSANAIALVAMFVITFGAAALGGYASVNSAAFYATLEKPAWAPSATVFGPVWSALYTLMAISAFLVVREIGWRAALVPIGVYVAQLALNAAWTWLFFGWRLGGAAFVEIAVLVAVIVLNALVFWRVRPLAGVLLVPYLAWVCFATLLTWSLWRSNPGVL